MHDGHVFVLKVQRFSNDVFVLYFPTMVWSLVRVRVCGFVYIYHTFASICLAVYFCNVTDHKFCCCQFSKLVLLWAFV